MGIRAHVQVEQPQYGGCVLSNRVSGSVATMLYQYEVALFGGEDDYQWEIDINDDLDKFMAEFSKDPNGMLDGYLKDDLKGCKYGEELLALLNEGLESAKENHYSTIIIDWF